MRHIIILFTMLVVAGGGVVGFARADDITPQEFLYAFHLRWAGGVPTWAESYELTTGGQVTPEPGAWRLRIIASNGTVLEEYPVNQQQDGKEDMILAYTGRGARAVLLDAQGVSRLEVDLSGSQVCNDDGVCDGQYGEDGRNCPVDCAGSVGSATISEQGSFGRQVGAWMMRVSFALVGVLLLGAALRTLDSRRRA
ncbi:MAG: hypothetical protein IT406_02505 [Candidatus Yanofskybacteria bacterium]|nr:hypothetical protein [Candidatus Yanofskybacteria bacterium]